MAVLCGTGKCGVYHVGSGSMALCIESIIQWGNDVVQVNGYVARSLNRSAITHDEGGTGLWGLH